MEHGNGHGISPASPRVWRLTRPACLLLALALLFTISVAWGAGERLSPLLSVMDDQDLVTRYEEAREQFLDLYNLARETIDADALAPAVSLYDIAQARAREGYYDSALQTIYRAISVLRDIIAQNSATGTGGLEDIESELRDTVLRQYDRLRELLAEAESVVRGVGSEEASALLEAAYRDARLAQEAMDQSQWRRALDLIRRASELAADAIKKARYDGLSAEAVTEEQIQEILSKMDVLVSNARDVVPHPADTEAARVLQQAQMTAVRAHEYAANGHYAEAARLAFRAMGLANLAIRLELGGPVASLQQVRDELERLSMLLRRADEMASNYVLATASQLIHTARALRDQAAQLIAPDRITPTNVAEALRLVRQGTELVLRAIQMLSPASLSAAQQALDDFQNQHLPRVEEVLRNYPSEEAASLVDRARNLAQDAASQIAAGQAAAALYSLRVATELVFQAVRVATAEAAIVPVEP